MRALSLADDKYIEEAAPQQAQKVKTKRIKHPRVWLTVAACFCCGIVALNMWLFIPFSTSAPDVSMYSDSEYYDIIVKLNEVTYVKPKYKNNFDKYFRGIFKGATTEDSINMEVADGAEVGSTYKEVTDNQVASVIEGDLIKRSDKHIFYLDNDTLRVYSIAGESSAQVGYYKVTGAIDDVWHYYPPKREMYLSEDCKTVTVVTQYNAHKSNQPTVALISLDVSDPANITLNKTVKLTGSYLSSRLTGGELLLMSRFNVGRDPDFSDESQFLPQINSGEGYESVPMDGIISPERLNAARYTVVCKLDPVTLELGDSSAFLSYSDDVYVSKDILYVARSYTYSEHLTEGYNTNTAVSDISAMRYSGEDFEFIDTVTVKGHVKDQYSMDEYEGLLRVVTTTDISMVKDRSAELGSNEVLIDSISTFRGDTSADLYCIDFETGEIVGELIGFAPKGETVRSVRFDGNIAYVCTAVQVTDPVFYIDLSDLDNITYKDTGTIQGFSTSLVNLKDGYLLGVGVGASSGTLKIEIYEETGMGVRSVCKYESKNTEYSQSYKSYYIDRENGLIGLGVSYYNYDGNYYDHSGRYILLYFNGYELTELLNEPVSGDNQNKRGVLIDGYMYMLGSGGLTAVKAVN